METNKKMQSSNNVSLHLPKNKHSSIILKPGHLLISGSASLSKTTAKENRFFFIGKKRLSQKLIIHASTLDHIPVPLSSKTGRIKRFLPLLSRITKGIYNLHM